MLNEVEQILDQMGSVKTGHFVLKSGRHSPVYVNNGEVTPHSEDLYEICQVMAPSFNHLAPHFFVGPAEAAIGLVQLMVLAYNRQRSPGAPRALALYASKEGDGFVFKRNQGDKVSGRRGIAMDDLGTTGSSVRSVVELVRDHGGLIDCVSYVCIRGNITPESVGGVEEIYSPLVIRLPDYEPDQCSLCARGVPINTDLGHGAAHVAKYGQPVAQQQ